MRLLTPGSLSPLAGLPGNAAATRRGRWDTPGGEQPPGSTNRRSTDLEENQELHAADAGGVDARHRAQPGRLDAARLALSLVHPPRLTRPSRGYSPDVASSPVDERAILRVGDGGADRDRDPVVVEAPLELRSRDGRSLMVTMRTPTGVQEDLELARGLLHGEGVLAAGEAGRVRRPDPAALAAEEVGNLVEIDLDADAVAEKWPPRSLAATSACGVCGKASIAALELRASPVASDLIVPAALIAELPDRLRAAQHVFGATGGLHAAAVFSAAGELLALREDVGRHNAVDKIVGWAMGEGRLPLADLVLCVSSRLGFEIAQKVVVAGCPIAVAVSAPSTLAIDLAERFRVTLCGFTRGGRFNLYSHPGRIA